MQLDEFVKRVQNEARLDAEEEAVQITRAVLETLGERLDRKVRNGVGAQLPNELKEYLSARAESGDRYGVTEFYNRVGARADLKYYDAAQRSWQVVSVLRQAISEGEIRDMQESLPSEFAELFGENTPGQVRPKP